MKLSSQMTDATVLTELGRRLERVRLDRNLSQEQVASEAGVSRQTLGRIEAGSAAKLPAVVRILRALDLLEALDLAVPEPLPSPIQQLDRQGRQRQRARPSAAARHSMAASRSGAVAAVPPDSPGALAPVGTRPRPDGWSWGTP